MFSQSEYAEGSERWKWRILRNSDRCMTWYQVQTVKPYCYTEFGNKGFLPKEAKTDEKDGCDRNTGL